MTSVSSQGPSVVRRLRSRRCGQTLQVRHTVATATTCRICQKPQSVILCGEETLTSTMWFGRHQSTLLDFFCKSSYTAKKLFYNIKSRTVYTIVYMRMFSNFFVSMCCSQGLSQIFKNQGIERTFQGQAMFFFAVFNDLFRLSGLQLWFINMYSTCWVLTDHKRCKSHS